MPHREVSDTNRATARRLRANMTAAERELWHALKAHRLKGLSFRRQVPIGPFVADFVCHDARLVIEVDGGQHSGSVSDRRRDDWFKANGFRVLRFWNNDVLGNIDGVCVHILETIEISGSTPLPTASPSPFPSRGEGFEHPAPGEVTTEWEVKR